MCRFSPQLVYPFLKSAESYRNEQVMDVSCDTGGGVVHIILCCNNCALRHNFLIFLQICKKYKLIEAIGYLLEKDGQLFQAFELMKDQFKEKLNTVFIIFNYFSHMYQCKVVNSANNKIIYRFWI